MCESKMSRIHYDGEGELYISGISTARECDKSGFDRILTTCQDSIEHNVSDEMIYSFHRMSDGPHNGYGGYHSYYMFEQAAEELYQALMDEETVLIHCHHGTSRSVSVATAALGRLLEEPRSEALALIHYYRPRNSYPDSLLMDHSNRYIDEHTDVSNLPIGDEQ